MEPQDLVEEELADVLEEISVEEVEPISRLPLYLPPWMPKSKVMKDSDAIKYKVFTLLLPEDISIEGELLTRVLQMKMEDWDLKDQSKYT